MDTSHSASPVANGGDPKTPEVPPPPVEPTVPGAPEIPATPRPAEVPPRPQPPETPPRPETPPPQHLLAGARRLRLVAHSEAGHEIL